MMRSQKALKKTAFHEAGHAVEAFMRDVPFRSVTIKENAESLGRVIFVIPARAGAAPRSGAGGNRHLGNGQVFGSEAP